ncbi:uncharacterized protein LOC144456100 isoform X2 [Phascolarctos cinereus]
MRAARIPEAWLGAAGLYGGGLWGARGLTGLFGTCGVVGRRLGLRWLQARVDLSVNGSGACLQLWLLLNLQVPLQRPEPGRATLPLLDPACPELLSVPTEPRDRPRGSVTPQGKTDLECRLTNQLQRLLPRPPQHLPRRWSLTATGAPRLPETWGPRVPHTLIGLRWGSLCQQPIGGDHWLGLRTMCVDLLTKPKGIPTPRNCQSAHPGHSKCGSEKDPMLQDCGSISCSPTTGWPLG